MYPDNLKKYPGTIQKRKDKFIFIINQKGKLIEEHEFPFTLETKDQVKQDVENYKKKWGIDHDKVKNSYQIKDIYIEVELDLDHKMLIDNDRKEEMEKYIWYHSNGQAYTMIPKGEWKCKDKRESISFHKLITGKTKIQHKNGNQLDNRMENLDFGTDEDTQNKIELYQRKKRKDNTSGCTGVYKVTSGKYQYWEMKGYNINETWIYKKYSVKKYGDEGAHSMACNYRDMYINQSFENKILQIDTSASSIEPNYLDQEKQ